MPKLEQVKLAVIGGSGLYNMEALADVKEYQLKTPFGDPSDAIVVGTLAGQRVSFLPRHGRGHRILPTEVNHRANLFALKMLGVERILSVSASMLYSPLPPMTASFTCSRVGMRIAPFVEDSR